MAAALRGDHGGGSNQLVEQHDGALHADRHCARRDGGARDGDDVLVGADRIARRLADELLAEALVAHLVAARLAVSDDPLALDDAGRRQLYREGDRLVLAVLLVDERVAVDARAGGRHIKGVARLRRRVTEAAREARALGVAEGQLAITDRLARAEKVR